MEQLPEINIKFNLPQVLFALSKAKHINLEWGRGTGKSTVFSKRVADLVKFMPRAKCGIVGETYQQILTRTLPSTIEGLEILGFKKDLHFFVGRRPPKEWKWQEAYQPPLVYDNYITFYNGTGFQLISLDNPDSGRGINLDAVLGDEAALMDAVKLSNNVLSANRGNIDRFRHTYLHHSILFASSTPMTLKGRWFLNQEEECRKNPGSMLYLRAPSTLNAHNLGEDFFKTNRRIMTDLQYNAEILCIRPNKVDQGFYPGFDEKLHTYNGANDSYLFSLNYDLSKLRENNSKFDIDCDKGMPIDVACDWGARINCMVCGQPSVGNEYKFINAMFVKSPLTIRELAHKFCDYYEYHHKKMVNFIYDHTAVYKDAVRTTTFADEFTKVLEQRGWTVNRQYHGQAPAHQTKYLFWSIAQKEDGTSNLPRFRYNKHNCKFLIVSMQQAGVLEGRNGFEKDKRPERREGAIDEETTHLSDAMDTLAYFKFKDRLATAGFIF